MHSSKRSLDLVKVQPVVNIIVTCEGRRRKIGHNVNLDFSILNHKSASHAHRTLWAVVSFQGVTNTSDQVFVTLTNGSQIKKMRIANIRCRCSTDYTFNMVVPIYTVVLYNRISFTKKI